MAGLLRGIPDFAAGTWVGVVRPGLRTSAARTLFPELATVGSRRDAIGRPIKAITVNPMELPCLPPAGHRIGCQYHSAIRGLRRLATVGRMDHCVRWQP